jgi:hypothetical protein
MSGNVYHEKVRDDSTKRTVALLNKMSPEELTVVSQWKSPPTFNKLPTTVSVNYSDKNFPALKSKNSKKSARASTKAVPDKNQKSQPLDTASHHSHNTSASVGTALTRDECTSLYTHLTESIVTKMNNQMLDMIKNQADLAAERERAYAAREEKQDQKFDKMMQTFMQLLPSSSKQRRKQTRRRKTLMPIDQTVNPPTTPDSDMDTSHADPHPSAPSSPVATSPPRPTPAPTTDSTVYDDSPSAHDPSLSETPQSPNSHLHKISDDEASSLRNSEDDSQSFDAPSSAHSMQQSASPSSDSGSTSDSSASVSTKRMPELENSHHSRAPPPSLGLAADVDPATSDTFRPSLGLDDGAGSMAPSVKYRPPQLPDSDSYADSNSKSRSRHHQATTSPQATSDDSAQRPPRSIETPASSKPSPSTQRHRQPGRGGTAGRSRGRARPPRSSHVVDSTANDLSPGSVSTILATADNSIVTVASTPPTSPVAVHAKAKLSSAMSSAIDDAIARETDRHQRLISPSPTGPPSVLRPPKEEPWKVVPSTKPHKRKSPPKLDPLSATLRKPAQGGQTPKKIFINQPATPTEEMPAQKK